MTFKRFLLPVFLYASYLGLALSSSAAPAAKSPAAKTARATQTISKNTHAATIVSVDDSAVHVTQTDGTTLDAEIRPTSVFMRDGVTTTAGAFKAGDKVILRTRTKASDGTLSVVLLCDVATANAIDVYRRKPLVGNVVSADDKTLVVKPDGADTAPLTLHVTAKTVYRKANADATAAAFPAGAGIVVITRGLPSGLLMASIVSDKTADAAAEKTALKPVSLVGIAADVQPDKNLLTIAPKTKPRQTIAVTDATKIKVDKADATLGQITPGMHVAARLGHQKDAAGHLIATSLSASPALPSATRKKATTISKKP